jgi:hypothetical protein
LQQCFELTEFLLEVALVLRCTHSTNIVLAG